MNRIAKSHIATLTAGALALTGVAGANAHVSVLPTISSAGNLTDSLTVGKNNTISFRIGHGIGLEKDIVHPVTKKVVAAVGKTFVSTKQFSVNVPKVALGEAGTSYPRPAFVPGWKTKSVKNADGTVTVTWTAISDDFALPNGPEGDTAATTYFDFGLRVYFATAAKGQKVTFPAVQTGVVVIPKAKNFREQRVRVHETWDGSTTDTVLDNNSRSTAPSVTVLP